MSAVMKTMDTGPKWNRMPARLSAFPSEERDRQLYQSARTVAGHRAELPVREADAWSMAVAEDAARMRADSWVEEMPWPT